MRLVMDGAGYVTTRQIVHQSPLDQAPDVPKGTRGHVEDEDGPGELLVDFGAPYGVVLTDISELA